MKLYEIVAFYGEQGPHEMLGLVEGRDRAVQQANFLISVDCIGIYAVGVRPRRRDGFSWSHLACRECGPTDERFAKLRRPPKYNRVPLPMPSNPLIDAPEEKVNGQV